MFPAIAVLAEKAGDLAEAAQWQGFFSQAALVIALFGFAAVLIYLFFRRNREIHERARQMPLDED